MLLAEQDAARQIVFLNQVKVENMNLANAEKGEILYDFISDGAGTDNDRLGVRKRLLENQSMSEWR